MVLIAARDGAVVERVLARVLHPEGDGVPVLSSLVPEAGDLDATHGVGGTFVELGQSFIFLGY